MSTTPTIPTSSPLPQTNRPLSPPSLSALLALKLSAIPPHHLPPLTLTDITSQSRTATHLPHLPPDLQLAFFLQHRAQLARHGDRAIQSEHRQTLALSRAAWYYRVDSEQQFQRYHDSVRWNLGLLVALVTASTSLCTGEEEEEEEEGGSLSTSTPTAISTTTSTSAPLSPSATRFATRYLAAVLEHHTAPTRFCARDAFVRCWKASRWRLFRVRAAPRTKRLQRAMKWLGREWARVMDAERQRVGGGAAFARGAGRFVGSLVPGRRAVAWREEEGEGDGECERERGREWGRGEEGHVSLEDGNANPLLDALRVPMESERAASCDELDGDDESSPVVELSVAMAVMQKMHPRTMLPVLMKLFPPGD